MNSIDYVCKAKPKQICGGFTVYYKFMERREESKTFNNSTRIQVSDYTGYKTYNKTDYTLKYISDIPNTEIIKCPRCGTSGNISHGWRVQCNDCKLWIETHGNTLETWGDRLRKVVGYFSTKYYHDGEAISEKEYNIWAVYYKLEKTGS